MKKHRLSALLLIAAVLTVSVTACKSNTENPSDDTTEPLASQSDTTVEKITEIDDGLSGLDFGGRTFNIYAYGQEICKREFEGEEETGETINDSIYKRNLDVEEKLNVKLNIVYSETASTAVGSMAEKNGKAGDNVYDLYSGHIMRMGQSVLSNVFMDIYDLNYIDFEKPWWPQYAVQNLSYKGHAYLMVGEVNLSALFASYGVFFNKAMAENSGVAPSELYQMVLDGKWTIDKQMELTRTFYSDVNGNDKMDEDDRFGLTTTTGFASSAYLWGFGQTICAVDSEGIQSLNLPNPLFGTIVEKIYDLYYASQGVRAVDLNDAGWTNAEPIKQNKTFMMNHYLYAAIRLRDLDTDFGILPYPKLDENQTQYYSIADGFHTALGVPVTLPVEDYAFAGAVIEALNAETYKTVVPAYYDIALKMKGARDVESEMVMDIIREGRVFDFGCVYDGWTGYAFTISDLMQQKSTNFASYYEKKESAALKYFDKVISCFEKIAD